VLQPQPPGRKAGDGFAPAEVIAHLNLLPDSKRGGPDEADYRPVRGVWCWKRA